jgi:hypothetical protein
VRRLGDDDEAPSDDAPTVERVGTTRQALPPCDEFGDCYLEPYEPTWPIAAGVCGQSPVDAQKKATAVWEYVSGGSVFPSTKYPCTAGGTLSTTKLGALRSKLAAARTSTTSYCDAGAATKTYVCGVSALVYDVYCEGLTLGNLNNIGAIAENLDSCWGTGVSGFFNVEDGSAWKYKKADGTYIYGLSIRNDPEPARLTAPLGGSTGAAAAAYYVNSGTGVTAIWHSGNWTSWSSGAPAAGTPCSTTSLGSWSDVTKTIVASGSYYRKCM